MFRRKETKRAFQQGVRDGKDKTYRGAYIRYQPKATKAGPVYHINEEKFREFPKLWALVQEKMAGRIVEPEKPAPYKRQPPAVEAQVCRDLRIYRKCSRTCTPRKFGGCKGWQHWKSCPQMEESEG